MGLTGFGFGMLAVPLLSSIMSPKGAIPLSVIFFVTPDRVLPLTSTSIGQVTLSLGIFIPSIVSRILHP